MANAVAFFRPYVQHAVAVLRCDRRGGESQIEKYAAIFQQHSSRLVIEESLQLLCELLWCGTVYHPIRSRSDVMWAV